MFIEDVFVLVLDGRRMTRGIGYLYQSGEISIGTFIKSWKEAALYCTVTQHFIELVTPQ